MKVLIISGGGARQEALTSMFNEYNASLRALASENASASLDENDIISFDFVNGVSSRDLRSAKGYTGAATRAALLPDDTGEYEPKNEGKKEFFSYEDELWKKGKALARERSVLGCFFAHLIAMKKSIEENYDLILEDNVRMPFHSDMLLGSGNAGENVKRNIAKEVRDVKAGSDNAALVYFGWLGSEKNLNWIFDTHLPRYSGDSPVAPFPFSEHYENDEGIGGTPLWGAYAYSITAEGYNAIMHKLKRDVGAMLWRSKKMKNYLVKPIDKVMPRRVYEAKLKVVIAKKPLFFRAPMLTSRIHGKWDSAFCESTLIQLSRIESEKWNQSFRSLYLTENEAAILTHYETTKEWISEAVVLGIDVEAVRKAKDEDWSKQISDKKERRIIHQKNLVEDQERKEEKDNDRAWKKMLSDAKKNKAKASNTDVQVDAKAEGGGDIVGDVESLTLSPSS
jgi:hypothetical protein